MRHIDHEAATAVELLNQAEGRLVKLVVNIADEALATELAYVLRDLATVRMRVETPGPADKRTSARIHERAAVCVLRRDGRKTDAALHDISAGGALIESDAEIQEGENCSLQLHGLEQSVKAVARSTQHGMTHLVFNGLAAPQVIALVKHLERHFMRY